MTVGPGITGFLHNLPHPAQRAGIRADPDLPGPARPALAPVTQRQA